MESCCPSFFFLEAAEDRLGFKAFIQQLSIQVMGPAQYTQSDPRMVMVIMMNILIIFIFNSFKNV